MRKIIDLTGQKFGRLTVLKFSHIKGHHYYWDCLCICGKQCTVDEWRLTSGKTKSCGCYRKNMLTTHGLREHRLYGVYQNMKNRCYREQDKSYKNYGARGITICDEWLNNFQAFYDWAIINGYDKDAKRGDCTIDRINVNGNYEPTNCRWITIAEQNKNKRPRGTSYEKEGK